MSFGYAIKPESPCDGLELTFSGEELEILMEAFRVTDAVNDPVGEKVLLRYLSAKVALQEEEARPKMGFIK